LRLFAKRLETHQFDFAQFKQDFPFLWPPPCIRWVVRLPRFIYTRPFT
jgi:hypothetical protein